MREVRIKTLNGSFPFLVQRFGAGEEATNWLRETGQVGADYLSPRLAEFSAYYSNRLSYEGVAGLVERVTGERQVSDAKIQQIVLAQAQAVSEQWAVPRPAAELPVSLPVIATQVELYEASAEEVLVLSDGIQVKQQKEEREAGGAREAVVTKRRVNTDVWQVEQADGNFVTLVSGLGEQAPVVERVQQVIAQEYGERESALPIVALSDGAKSIRCDLLAIFGVVVTVILDWYHLEEKVWNLMSMIARNKEEKEKHSPAILGQLWRGQVSAAREYLRSAVVARNIEKLQELEGYLAKHESEIIDYERRKECGKAIGSGRIEKCVDQVIGARQKHKGMSWSKSGSQALGILKTCEMNGDWERLWFSPPAAA